MLIGREPIRDSLYFSFLSWRPKLGWDPETAEEMLSYNLAARSQYNEWPEKGKVPVTKEMSSRVLYLMGNNSSILQGDCGENLALNWIILLQGPPDLLTNGVV